MTTKIAPVVDHGVGTSPARPDGVPKVTGNFAYASDLYADQMLWGATLRSPYAKARLVRIDTAPALAMAGVRAVITQDDVPGLPTFGQEHQDQPVLLDGEARFWGEPVAVVAADDPETARLATQAIVVEWEPLSPDVDPEQAQERGPWSSRATTRRRLRTRPRWVPRRGLPFRMARVVSISS